MFVKLSLDERFENWYKRQDPTLLKLEKIGESDLDMEMASNKYVNSSNSADVSFDANANNDGYMKSPADHYSEMMAGLKKLKNFDSLYKVVAKLFSVEDADSIFTSVLNGDLYIHDASHINIPYCFAYSSSRLMTEGRYWSSVSTVGPKHADAFVSQVIETTIELSNEFAGAIAVSDFLVNYAWYSYTESLPNDTIKQHFQRFIYLVNGKHRATQPPFVNISVFDINNIKELFKNHVYPDHSSPLNILEEIDRVQKLFMDVFSKGDSKGKPFRFPVVTTNFLIDKENGFPMDEKFLDLVSKVNYQKGVFNIYISNSVGKLSSCCRLVNDFKLLKGMDSFGNGGLNVGSARVVTINLPRIGYLAKDDEDFTKRLNVMIDKCEKILVAHRELLKKRVKQGCLKFIEPLQYVNIDKMLFSTIGIIGVYESAIFRGYDFTLKKEAPIYNFITKMLKQIRERADGLSDKHKVGFNVEQVPAESLAFKFVEKDRYLFGGSDQIPFELYSNQFVPLTFNADVFDRMIIDGMFSKILSGGGITHLNFMDKFSSPEQMKKVIMFAINCGVEHFAIEQIQSECAKHHIITGNFDICPICCENIIEKYVRVVGYRVPVSSINKVRRIYDVPNRKYQKPERISVEENDFKNKEVMVS